jgi:3-deoxy-manno-octulosonate cytidylyltransferase (CMP-KDO synthetase)
MYKSKRIVCVIPARLSSSRFPNKPLAKIKGREMVLRVADIASKSKYLDGIIIATEDKEIQQLANDNDYLSIVTGKHYTCTHRVAEVAGSVLADFIFNLQGDEPLTDPNWIDDMIQYGVDNDIDVLQSSRLLEDGEVEDEDVVKMIVNNGKVVHMQRECDVICDNIITQLGLYLYKTEVIKDFPNLDMTFVKYWRGLDTIGFIGKYDVIPFDLHCGKVRAVDRPSHIHEVEQQL